MQSPVVEKLKLKTPNSLVMDIYGVITSHEFKNELKKFANDNLTIYINENFGDKRFIKLVNRLIKENDELYELYPDAPKVNMNFNTVPDEQLGLAKKQIEDNVRFRIEKKFYGNTILFFYEDIWLKGYKSGALKAQCVVINNSSQFSVYEDVLDTLRMWRLGKYIKIYTLASGKSIGQRLFLGNTVCGNLNHLIANCLDPSSFGKEDKKCFIAISLALRSDPEKLIYLTDSVKRMEVAKEVKFQVVLVQRPDNPIKIDPSLTKDAHVITRLQDIEFIDDENRVKDCC